MLPAPSERSALHNRVVIIHQGALGDFLLAFSALEGLHRANPRLRMDFWSKPHHVSLVKNKPFVGAGHSSEGPELIPFYHDTLWQTAAVPSFFLDADAVIAFGQASGRAMADRLSRRLGRPVHWIQSFPDSRGCRVHVTDFIVAQLKQIGWSPAAHAARIEAPPDVREAVVARMKNMGVYGGEKPVVLHPGSGGTPKIWPLGNWWALIHRLLKTRRPVLLTIGPADEALLGLAAAAKELGVHLLEDLSLPSLSALLAECGFYVGNDSGVSHLAAATGISSVVIFGPTDPAVWAPRGENVTIIQSGWLASEVLSWSPHAPELPLEPSILDAVEALVR